MEKRVSLFDNIKGILIFLVVLGHIIEPLTGNRVLKSVYLIIYSFHMPLFAFVSGYFAKFDAKKILKNLIYPYVIFQVLYWLFARFVLKEASGFSFASPYWILWYMVSLILWKCFIPFFETKSKKQGLFLFLLSVCVSLSVGFSGYFGYFMSLSRTLVFFPFFLGAYYTKSFIGFEKIREKRGIRYLSAILVLLSITGLIVFADKINPAWFYGSYPYKSLEYSCFIRLANLLTAFSFVLFFTVFVPKGEIPLLTNIGKRCILVFLIHGFIVKIYRTTAVYRNFYLILPMTFAIVLLLANKYSEKIFSYLISYKGGKKNGNNLCNK